MDKDTLKNTIESLRDVGPDVFGDRIWDYVKLAVEEYNGEPITPGKESELMMRVLTPRSWRLPDEEPRAPQTPEIIRPLSELDVRIVERVEFNPSLLCQR